MRKTIATVLVVLGLALIVVGFSVKAFPQWLSLPGGLLLLLAGAFAGVAELGGKLKDWRDFLFGGGEKKKSRRRGAAEKASSPARLPSSQRTQDMQGSRDGEQVMHGASGTQKQKMEDSPGGKQQMD